MNKLTKTRLKFLTLICKKKKIRANYMDYRIAMFQNTKTYFVFGYIPFTFKTKIAFYKSNKFKAFSVEELSNRINLKGFFDEK